jgi:hypothetical protein
MQATTNAAARTRGDVAAPEPIKFQKRGGATLYSVNAYFATNTSETLADKILRLAKNNGLDFQSENAEPMRTGRLPERSAVA